MVQGNDVVNVILFVVSSSVFTLLYHKTNPSQLTTLFYPW